MTDLISDYGQKIIDTSPYRIAEYKDWVEKEKIGPLVRVKWNQNTPYNNMCNDNLVNLKLTRVLHIQFIYNQHSNIFNPLIKKQHRNKTIN